MEGMVSLALLAVSCGGCRAVVDSYLIEKGDSVDGPIQYPRVCRGGHGVRGSQDEREGRCRVCRIRSKRRYEQSAKGRETQYRYEASEKG
jgi:hypothetical protein